VPGCVVVFVADLHIHSRYSRACSRDLDLSSLTWWARRKGITLLGTGDFTHPAWYEHLREALVPAEPGLYRLRPELDADVSRRLPGRLASAEVRFLLSVEISTIYKRGDRTRKVHHLVYQPDLDAAARFNTALGRIGNLGSDGRPILGLDSRDLLEITLEASPDGYLVPAHIWTPWFSALGSKSGFDAIADCYADLAPHIFAVETGLSSDPEMNWRVSSLDGYTLVSNSDAHSAPALGREATLLDTPLDYFAVRDGLRDGSGVTGTLEFFPEEGKYHADGHRACGVNWQPEQTRAAGGACPECGKPLTVGVLARVEELADRPAGQPAPRAREVTHLIQLAEILGEIDGVGPKAKSVTGKLATLAAELGPELEILRTVPVEAVTRVGGELLGEAITRLRAGRVRRTPGFDGEYGVIKLFEPGELASRRGGADALFDLPASAPRAKATPPKAPARRAVPAPRADTAKPAAADTAGPVPPASPVPAPRQRRAPAKVAPPPLAPEPSPHGPLEPMLAGMEEVGTGLLDRLDAMQRVAASAPGGPLLIVAGPGTGKTRTLTHRIAYLCAELGVYPEECLAITFTRRAAEELRHRLAGLLGPVAEDVTVGTFHSLGLSMLRENAERVGLSPAFRVADEAERLAALTAAGLGERDAKAALRRGPGDVPGYAKALRERDLVDLDELVTLPVTLLREDPELALRCQARWPWIFVDEYQDVDADQYDLLRLLAPPDGNLCAIGDPDQAIYSFRGADVGYFLRFARDFTDARLVRLTRNYRSSAPIIAAAVQAIAPSTLVPGRRLDPARLDLEAPPIGLYPANSVADEADFVTRTIDELVGGLSHRSLDSGRVDSRAAAHAGLSFGDIAVLYRTDAQAAAIVDALARGNVPVQKRSHDRLRDRPGVAAITRELRYVTPGRGSSVAERIRAVVRELTDRPPLDGAVTADDLHLALDLLAPLAGRCGEDLERFLAEVATGAEVDALDPRAQAVTLLTLHAAKGLEFPVVFLVGVEDGLLPLRLPAQAPDDAATAEERRLFFVGLTRAQDRLFVSHARRRVRQGTERETGPSVFLRDIDPGLLERRGDDTPRPPRDLQLRLL
jgi:DNA helicase II / ATP-dependent DNA helicase PcrA